MGSSESTISKVYFLNACTGNTILFADHELFLDIVPLCVSAIIVPFSSFKTPLTSAESVDVEKKVAIRLAVPDK